MADENEAVRRVTARVAEEQNAVIGGDPALVRSLMTAPGLQELGPVIPVVADAGELSLSSLIAQLSGEADLGGHDDAVLELGFQRLTGPGRTILVVQAPHGIGRSALRYLQHMVRMAPRLAVIVSNSTALDALLAEPGFAALRTRLAVAPAIEVAVPPSVIVPARLSVRPISIGALPRTNRASTVWTATALSAAAVAALAWFTQGAPRAVSPAFASVPVQPAVVLPPPLEVGLPPSLALVASPLRAAVPAPAVASAAAPPLAPQPAISRSEQPPGPRDVAVTPPPPAASQHPVLATTLPLPPLLKPAPGSRPRRPELARLPRQYPEWPAPPRYENPDYYAYAPAYREPAPEWARREARRREPYLGTFAVDPYGNRVFRYDP